MGNVKSKEQKTESQRISQHEASTSNFMNPKADHGSTVKYRDNKVNTGQQINCITACIGGPAVHGSTSIERDSLEKETNDLSEKLKKWYKDIKLPNVPWMDEGNLLLGSYYVHLQLRAQQQCTSIEETGGEERSISTKEKDDDKISISTEDTDDYEESTSTKETDDDDESRISIEEIFDENSPVSHGAKGIDIHDKAPKRILINAPPGYGKTTLAHKIIYDWVQQEKEYVRRFKLAFLIKLRYLENNVQNEIEDIARQSRFESMDDVTKIVSKNASSTLVILDGLDELKPKDRINVYKVLFRSELCNVTVVTTCRMGCYTITREEKDRLFKGIEKSTDFQDRTVTIKGLSESNREKLLGMFVQSPDKDEVINRVRKIIDDTENVFRDWNYDDERELFQCPLFVILLAFILQEKSDVVIETRTDLFKCLFDCVIRRSCCKNGTQLPNNFTLFGTQESWARYRNVVYQFGKLSSEALADEFKSLQFDCNEERNVIYEMGFFIKHCDVNKFSKRYYYETFHLSIMEFASAYCLWLDYKNNDCCVIKNETFRKIISLLEIGYSSSLTIPFLFGLLNDELSNFFNDLIPYGCCFIIPNENINYFDYCKSVPNFSDTVQALFSRDIDRHIWVIDKQLYNKLLPWLRLYLFDVTGEDFVALSQSPVVNYLQIRITSRSNCDLPIEFNFSKIRCKKLKFVIESSAKNIEMWLQIFNSITATESKKFLYVYCDKYFRMPPDIVMMITRTLHVMYPSADHYVALKTDLVTNYTNLSNIVTKSFSELGAIPEDILPTLSVFANLQTVCIIGYKKNVDIGLLTNFGKKHWKSVHLTRVGSVNCSFELKNYKCISSFRNLKCVNSPTVFGSIVPDLLHCDSDYIIEAMESSSFLDRWLSVKELILVMENVVCFTEIMSCLERLCRIHTPKIRLHIEVFGSNGTCDCSEDDDRIGKGDEFAVINFLKLIHVTEIRVYCDCGKHRISSSCESRSLFNQFARTVHEKQIILHTLIISHNSKDGVDVWVNDVLTCVSNGNVVRSIVILGPEGTRLSFDDVSRFDFTKFNIQFGYVTDYCAPQFCGSYREKKYGRYKCICISLKQ